MTSAHGCRTRARAPWHVVTAALLAFATTGAYAETEGEIGVRFEHTDNVDLTETDERSDLLRVPYIRFGWDTDRRALTASVDGTLEYLDFRDDTNSDDTTGELSAVADLHLIENRLDFHVENRFQQVRFDELDPQTPENTEDANTFVMGPDLRFDPSPVDELTFGARYGSTYFERGTDSERVAVGTIWSHRLSPINEFAVNLQRQEVEFTEDDPGAIDYTLDEAGLGLTHRLARGEVSLTVGGRRVERDDGTVLERGFGRFDWSYTPTRRTEFDLRAESGLTDAGVRLLSRNEATVELPDADAFNSSDIVVLSEVQARLLRRGARLDVTLGGRASEEDFESGNLDRETWGGSLALEYPLTPVDRIEWSLRGARTDYVLINRRDDDITTSLRLRHLLGRSLFVEGGVRYWERDSSENGGSFEENRTFIALGYRWGGY